jgi:hypothetical protein
MRQVLSRLVVTTGMLALGCATAMEEGPLNGDPSEDDVGTGGSLPIGGLTSTSGSSSAGTTTANGGKGGSGTSAFGGSSTSGGAGGNARGGSTGASGNGGAAAGSSMGGKGGTTTGGSASGGSTNGGSASGGGGSATGGGGSAGSTSTTCNGVPDWTSKTYALGDTVASTCSGVFAAGCSVGQSHEFECNPGAGVAALRWCQSREPGVGNGWAEAWIDKGQCQ